MLPRAIDFIYKIRLERPLPAPTHVAIADGNAIADGCSVERLVSTTIDAIRAARPLPLCMACHLWPSTASVMWQSM